MKSIFLILTVVVLGIVACDTPQPTTGSGTDSTSINSNGNTNSNHTTDSSGTKRDSMPNPYYK
jgi:hypothetical protein